MNEVLSREEFAAALRGGDRETVDAALLALARQCAAHIQDGASYRSVGRRYVQGDELVGGIWLHLRLNVRKIDRADADRRWSYAWVMAEREGWRLRQAHQKSYRADRDGAIKHRHERNTPDSGARARELAQVINADPQHRELVRLLMQPAYWTRRKNRPSYRRIGQEMGLEPEEVQQMIAEVRLSAIAHREGERNRPCPTTSASGPHASRCSPSAGSATSTVSGGKPGAEGTGTTPATPSFASSTGAGLGNASAAPSSLNVRSASVAGPAPASTPTTRSPSARRKGGAAA